MENHVILSLRVLKTLCRWQWKETSTIGKKSIQGNNVGKDNVLVKHTVNQKNVCCFTPNVKPKAAVID